MKPNSPKLREAVLHMTPAEMRARMSPAALRKIRAYQALAIVFAAAVLVLAGLAVLELVALVRTVLRSPGTPADVFAPASFALLAGAGLASAGVRWCAARMTAVTSAELVRSLKGDLDNR